MASAAAAEDAPSAYAEAKLRAADAARDDYFGSAVAISDDTAVVGAAWNDDLGRSSGSAYIFQRKEGDPLRWVQVAKLIAAEGGTDDYFGNSVGVSGDTVVVGATGDGLGSVSVFQRPSSDPTRWIRTAKLFASDGEESEFGNAVAISGDTAVVGAFAFDPISDLSGSAYVFRRDAFDMTLWHHLAKLTPPERRRGDRFGQAVALSGDTAVVGSPGAGVYEFGAAHVFWPDSSNAFYSAQVVTLWASDRSAGDSFGSVVAISGNTILIGAPSDDDLGYDSGSAYIFERAPENPAFWTEVAKLYPADGSDGDKFGIAVALSGDHAVIGAYGDEDYRGSAYVFRREPMDPGTWTQIAKITAPDGVSRDFFGSYLAASGDAAIIGAYGDDDGGMDSGSAYVFRKTWVNPIISLSGICPGEVTVDAVGATPWGPIEIWGGFVEGPFVLPAGPCTGQELGLTDARLAEVGRADGKEEATVTRSIPAERCAMKLQGLDLTSCAETQITPLP